MTHKSRKVFFKFMFSSVGWPLLRAEGFFCNLDVLYGGLGIGKLPFFFNFWSLKPWIRIGVQSKMLDPDPDEMNAGCGFDFAI